MKNEERRKRRRLCVTITLLLVACLFCTPASAETRQYLLGDIDNFIYNGVGSVDDVYVDPAWHNYFSGLSAPVNGFDTFATEQSVPFTFLYGLSPGETVVSATLTLALRSTVPGEGGGGLQMRTPDIWTRPSFGDLGWYPIDTETSVFSVDMATVDVVSWVPYLQGGIFDTAIKGNIAVDYAILTLDVVPEPATMILLAFGGLLLRRPTS